MISCIVINKRGKCEITIKGHAGYAEKGKDIVCSAVTVLAISLANVIPFKNITKVQIENGYYYLNFKNKSVCKICLKMFLKGMAYIERCYPKHLKIQKGVKEYEV